MGNRLGKLSASFASPSISIEEIGAPARSMKAVHTALTSRWALPTATDQANAAAPFSSW
jgi:predicted trehalose synthase